MSTAPSAGANGSVTVTTTRDCTWDAASGVNWIALTSAANGQGNGTVSYRVDPNGVPASRKGTIDVNGTSITVTQEAAPCRFTVSPLNSSVSASASNVSLTVETLTGCSWTAATQTPWIHVASGGSASASGPVAIAIDANAGGARSGTLTVAGETVTINQAEAAPGPPTPAPCSYGINPTGYSAPAGGATGSIAVTTAPTCTWTATSNASWIAFTSVPSSTGSGTLGFSVAANAGPARSGTATIAGQTFTVAQAPAGCAYSISPAIQSFDSGGGPGSLSVTSSSWCSWTASAGASWVSMASGGSGTGNGTIAFNVAANTGAARNSTITVGGQTFTITQAAAACTYGISPASQSVDGGGGSGSFAVTTSTWCAWTASAGASWISITSGGSGTGNGTVAFSVGANAGAARTGTITAGGQTFTISEAAAPPCTYSIAPGSQSVDYVGGSGTVAVTASSATCAWTAASNNTDWMTVTSGASGTGNGSVAFSAAANSGAARTGTITIAGQTFTVSQAAAPPPCTYSIAPASQDFAAAGGSGSVTVTASGAGCSWTAVSNAAWLTITSAASGTGSGSITFTAAVNGDGVPRTGTLTVAGQTFTVNQSN